MVRLNLYNRDLFCGAQAILWEMEELEIRPLPSLRTINRILSRNDLTHRRTGRYEAKGTPYPKLPSLFPNQTHQADLVGPCYLKGPARFYGLNAVDMATARCGLYTAPSKSGQSILDGFWDIWKRLGIRSTSRWTTQCPSLEVQHTQRYGASHSTLPSLWRGTLVHSHVRAMA